MEASLPASEEVIRSPPNTPDIPKSPVIVPTDGPTRHQHHIDLDTLERSEEAGTKEHLDTHLRQQERRREFEGETEYQRLEQRAEQMDDRSKRGSGGGNRQYHQQGDDEAKHKKSGGQQQYQEKQQPPQQEQRHEIGSLFISHLTHYPVLTDTINQLVEHSPPRLRNFLKVHNPATNPPPINNIPGFTHIDTLADSILTTVDAYFPQLGKPTPELYEDTIKKPAKGLWYGYAAPIVGKVTDPVLGRVNCWLEGKFPPSDDKSGEKGRKDERKKEYEGSVPPAVEPSRAIKTPRGKTYAQASVEGTPLERTVGGQKRTESSSSSSDEASSKQPKPQHIQLERTYQIVKSIAQDAATQTKEAVRSHPDLVVYRLPVFGGKLKTVVNWAAGVDSGSGNQGRKKKKEEDAGENEQGRSTGTEGFGGGAMDSGFATAEGGKGAGVTVVTGGREM